MVIDYPYRIVTLRNCLEMVEVCILNLFGLSIIEWWMSFQLALAFSFDLPFLTILLAIRCLLIDFCLCWPYFYSTMALSQHSSSLYGLRTRGLLNLIHPRLFLVWTILLLLSSYADLFSILWQQNGYHVWIQFWKQVHHQ